MASKEVLAHDIQSQQTGTFILRKLISDVPLSQDGPGDEIKITCVEVHDENLYIGTSAAEVLHFVLIPAEPDDPTGQPTPILASRLQPAHKKTSNEGVQQILLLPRVNKACVVCNNSLTFYNLPELSPDDTKPLACSFVGGLDEDEDEENADSDFVAILMAQPKRLLVVQIREDDRPRTVRSVEYSGCLHARRRGNIVCSADNHSYALLDVDEKQKVPLFPISSLDEEADETVAGPAQDISTGSHTPSKSVSSASVTPQREGRTHGRSSSLGIFGDQKKSEGPASSNQSRYGFDTPELFARSRSPWPAPSPDNKSPERASTPLPAPETSDKPLPLPPSVEKQPEAEPPPKPKVKEYIPLSPHVLSPTENEFLLTTGTAPNDPGVGSFVNLDGDPSRGTIEFTSYPGAVVLDGQGLDPSASVGPGKTSEEGYILATVTRRQDEGWRTTIEIQRWDTEPGETHARKEWLELPGSTATDEAHHLGGLRTVVRKKNVQLPDIGSKLTQKRIDLRGLTSKRPVPVRSSSLKPDDHGAREYAERLSQWSAQNVLWSRDQVWWVLRNPLILKLDAQLEESTLSADGTIRIGPNREQIEALIYNVRSLQGWTEVDFLGLNYIRQKASVLLFIDLVIRTMASILVFEKDKRATEEALVQGEVDPRIILALLPLFNEEVIQAPSGISIPGGLKSVLEYFTEQHDISKMQLDPKGPFGDNLLQLIRRYLMLWRKKKGMASIADEKEVFQTVDAALLHVLLLLDKHNKNGSVTAAPSIRSELYGVVDSGVDCFERAIALLEKFKRLYVLSRLYQSRRMAARVLHTWRRILDGEDDHGGEFIDGEREMLKYLRHIRDESLIEEYGTWLANRNPKLGVQLFADDNAKVKFKPARAVEILKEKAPSAVKDYLEFLVFGKKLSQYSNDLIGFYLDSVIAELASSSETRTILLQTYETYRALQPPKPTYKEFITENSLGADWWDNRLRLLQLLGSNSGSEAGSYNVPVIFERLQKYEQELVPEMIILAGRKGEHEAAIRLLTHGLGDIDTAVNYCLLGGSSIFRPASGFIPEDAIPSHDEQAKLFKILLKEFLQIEDLSERIERTGVLLERFGGWFDVVEVLKQVPDDWAVEIFSGFLVGALRGLVKDKHESEIVKALNATINTQLSANLVEKFEDGKPLVERDTRDEVS